MTAVLSRFITGLIHCCSLYLCWKQPSHEVTPGNVWWNWVCGAGNGADVGGSGLPLLCGDLSAICQSAPGLSAWSRLMKTRCFPWLLLPSRTSPSAQPCLANTGINTHTNLSHTCAHMSHVCKNGFWSFTSIPSVSMLSKNILFFFCKRHFIVTCL